MSFIFNQLGWFSTSNFKYVLGNGHNHSLVFGDYICRDMFFQFKSSDLLSKNWMDPQPYLICISIYQAVLHYTLHKPTLVSHASSTLLCISHFEDKSWNGLDESSTIHKSVRRIIFHHCIEYELINSIKRQTALQHLMKESTNLGNFLYTFQAILLLNLHTSQRLLPHQLKILSRLMIECK